MVDSVLPFLCCVGALLSPPPSVSQPSLAVSSVTVTPPVVLPGQTITATVVLSRPLTESVTLTAVITQTAGIQRMLARAAGVTRTAQAAVETCGQGTIPPGTTTGSTTCTVPPTTAPGRYLLTVTAAAGRATATGNASFQVSQVRVLNSFGSQACVL